MKEPGDVVYDERTDPRRRHPYADRTLQDEGARVGRDEEAGALPGAQNGGAGTECGRPVQAEQGMEGVLVRSTFPESGMSSNPI